MLSTLVMLYLSLGNIMISFHFLPFPNSEIPRVPQILRVLGEETRIPYTVYPKKYAHGFVVLCFVVVMQSFIMNSHEVFIHIHQGCFAGTGAIVRLPQCQWSKPDGYGKISQCITTTKHSKAKTVCIFLGIYCNRYYSCWWPGDGRSQVISSHGIDICCRIIPVSAPEGVMMMNWRYGCI